MRAGWKLYMINPASRKVLKTIRTAIEVSTRMKKRLASFDEVDIVDDGDDVASFLVEA